MGKIHTTVDAGAVSDAFIEEFGGDLTDDQFEALEGFRDVVDVVPLPDGNEVDPRQDPVTARRVLLTPASKCEPSDKPFVYPLVEYLKAGGADLSPEVQMLSRQFDLHLVRFSLDAVPRGKESFTRVEIRFSFPTEHQTYQMTPDTNLETKFAASGKVNLGVNANASFAAWEASVPGIGKAGAGGSGNAQAGMATSWEYELVQARIVATGIGSSFAEWIFNEPKRMIGSVPLAVILAVPRDSEQLTFEATGSVNLARGLLWWKRETVLTIESTSPIVVKLPGSR